MTISIKILLLAVLVTALAYMLIVLVKYYRGLFQYSPFFPKRYIFPKRITKDIRPNVLKAFQDIHPLGLSIIENQLRAYVTTNKLYNVDIAMERREFDKLRIQFGEDNFKYFLYLYEASIICGIVKTNNRNQQDVWNSKLFIRNLNEYVMTNHLKRFITNTERSVILAEIIHQAIFVIRKKGDKIPYNFDFYDLIKRDTVIEKHLPLIKAAIEDRTVITIISNCWLNGNPIYIHSRRVDNLLFVSKVALFTNWLKD